MCIYIYICVSMRTYICMCVCLYVVMFESMYVFIWVYIYNYVCIQGFTGGKDLISGECSLGQTITI